MVLEPCAFQIHSIFLLRACVALYDLTVYFKNIGNNIYLSVSIYNFITCFTEVVFIYTHICYER